jgi:hypothetical protein
MLANNLSLDDEEAVQAELKELQEQAVSFNFHSPISVHHRFYQLRSSNTESAISLPSVPDTKPAVYTPPGIYLCHKFSQLLTLPVDRKVAEERVEETRVAVPA